MAGEQSEIDKDKRRKEFANMNMQFFSSTENFTSNEEIDCTNTADGTACIVGYVSKLHDNEASPKAAKYRKFIVNNGKGREVQISAWRDFAPFVKKTITQVGMVVCVKNVKAKAVDNKYNFGNVSFELLFKENSKIHVLGTYTQNISTPAEKVSIIESYDKIKRRIQVQGIVKSVPRRFKNLDQNYFIGSIMEGRNKLEIKCGSDEILNYNLEKGWTVEIEGVMEQFLPGPPALNFTEGSKISIISKEKIPFEVVYSGYKTYVA